MFFFRDSSQGATGGIPLGLACSSLEHNWMKSESRLLIGTDHRALCQSEALIQFRYNETSSFNWVLLSTMNEATLENREKLQIIFISKMWHFSLVSGIQVVMRVIFLTQVKK